jgi:hypothetical protein
MKINLLFFTGYFQINFEYLMFTQTYKNVRDSYMFRIKSGDYSDIIQLLKVVLHI